LVRLKNNYYIYKLLENLTSENFLKAFYLLKNKLIIGYVTWGFLYNKYNLILLTRSLLSRTQRNIPNIFLICCLFTIQPENEAFKEFILKRDLSIVLEVEYIINKLELVSVVKNLQNNKSYSLLAYFFITPLLSNKKKAKVSDEIIFLKHYLKRFKYFYYKYGAQEIGNCNTELTVKEINYYAVLALAIILGI
jgi:hypothetical protein